MKSNKYKILNGDDFEQIAKNTNYEKSYVRQVLRAYSGKTKFNQRIFDEADEMVSIKIKNFQGT